MKHQRYLKQWMVGSWQPIKDIPSLEGSNNETSMAYKAIYKNNLLVIPTKMNNDVFS